MLHVLNIFWSLCVYTVHSIKSLFSVSLSTSEQTIFEEEFKYLIVTSPLFNGTPQFQDDMPSITRDSTSVIQNSTLIYTTSLGMIISFLAVIYMNLVTPLLPCFVYLSICYFLYRHNRHTQIRSIHASALDSMHHIILLSRESDITLYHLFAHNDQSQLQKLGHVLSRHFETYIDVVHQLQPLIDVHNLARLREMYNVNDEIPSTLLEFDSSEFKMEDIELIYSFITWKQREYLLHLLALDVMSNNKSAHYGKNWRQAIRVNHELVEEYKEFNRHLASIVENLPKNTVVENEVHASPVEQVETDKRTLTMVHKLDAVEKLIQEIQANVFLCKQDTRPMSSGRVNLEKLSKRFQNIDTNMKALSSQWEGLHGFLNDQVTGVAEIPSPPTSPKDDIQRSQSFRYGNISHNYTSSRLRRIQSLKLDKSNKHT